MAQVLEMESTAVCRAVGALQFEVPSALVCAALDAIDYGVVVISAGGGLEVANVTAPALHAEAG